MHAPIVFVTDFGTDDTYAAALAAACWRIDPALTALAGMHAVPPGDVLAGAYHVKAIAHALPEGSVVCAVVDPGVGTDRRAIAVAAGGVRCVAPDNGLVSYLWAEAELSGRQSVALATPTAASATFHGRDVFAPAAARLAAGASLSEVGEPVQQPPALRDDAFASAAAGGGVLHGVVCVIDHFGNAITTLRETDLRGREVVALEWDGGGTSTVVRTYGDVDDGLAVLLGSVGHLEIVARGRPAASLGGPGRGAAVYATLRP
jgi:S-adenosyl-L-methionine hydrolase (adenosine-forming)